MNDAPATPRRKLRAVVLYSSGHLGSAAIFSEVARMEDIEVVGVVRAEAADTATATGRSKTWKAFRKVGAFFGAMLAWQRVVQAAGFAVGRLLPWRRRFRSGGELTAELGVPVHCTADVNGAESVAWLRDRTPDLLLSACFTQILKRPVIDVPRTGVLNIHPGFLPAWRGAMTYFWPLRRRATHGGVSVHWIDEGIDTGALLARRKFRLRPGTTQQRVLVRAAVTGARLLKRVVGQLARGRRPAVLAVDESQARYHPMPGAADFDAYFARHRFFRIRDVLGLLWRPLRAAR